MGGGGGGGFVVGSNYDAAKHCAKDYLTQCCLEFIFLFQTEKCVFEDAVGLIMYHAKIASTLNRIDALKIRSFLSHTLPDLCYYPKYV